MTRDAPRIEMYSSDWCGFCMMARRLLSKKGVEVEIYPVDGNPALRSEMMERSGRTSVPQIFIGGTHVGGCDELHELDRDGRLDQMLAGNVAVNASPRASADADGDGQRIDKWLWAARFFKTRSAATAAVSGGKVEVDGERVKPSRRVRPGNRLRIRRGVMEYTVDVRGVCAQRRPASEARTLYEETAESIAARTAEQALRTQAEQLRSQRLGRPDKHARREIARLKGH